MAFFTLNGHRSKSRLGKLKTARRNMSTPLTKHTVSPSVGFVPAKWILKYVAAPVPGPITTGRLPTSPTMLLETKVATTNPNKLFERSTPVLDNSSGISTNKYEFATKFAMPAHNSVFIVEPRAVTWKYASN